MTKMNKHDMKALLKARVDKTKKIIEKKPVKKVELKPIY
jgi:hypothetical protein